MAALGCQAPLYRNELERLKREAVTTQNPQLLSFVGDAYRNPRSGLGDMGQAYRWYLMAAVRGDPLAMQRLSEMNRKGIGVPKDNVKAMGYARLVQRMSQPGGATQPNVLSMINELGDEMAVEEVALAERFAGQLQERIRREGSLDGAADAGGSVGSLTVTPERGLPGVPQPAAPKASAPGSTVPGSTLPGVPVQRAP
ncbi:sel1 repeat family protein [Diaphorobacter sp. HDW4B]|nr:sel1 repeat family protein [Diaphorobacter sp. HDW4B]